MKKLAATLLSVLLLGGCAISEEDLPNQILTQLNDLPSMKFTAGVNMNKVYYSYYLPGGIGRRDSSTLSEVFVKNGYRLVMNFDPSAIIIQTYYRDTTDITVAVSEDINTLFVEPTLEIEDNKYIYTGNYLTKDEHIHPYTLQIVKSDTRYLLYMDAQVVKLYTYVPIAEIPSSLKAMVRIMASIEYDETKVLQDFSIKSLEETSKKSIEYLKENLPTSGSLNDLLNGTEEPKNSGDSTE